VKNQPVLTISGTLHTVETSHWKFTNLPTSPRKCCRTTCWSAKTDIFI